MLDVELLEENSFYYVNVETIKKKIEWKHFMMRIWGSVLLQITNNMVIISVFLNNKAGLFHVVKINFYRELTVF